MIAAFALCVPAHAQDPDRVFAETSALFARNEYAKAIEVLQSIPESAPDNPHARKHLSIAQALMNMGRAAEAAPHIQEARTIAGRLDDPAIGASVEIAEGNYRRLTREPRLAMEAFQRAVVLADKSGAPGTRATAYDRLSDAYQAMEDYGRALHYSELAFALHEAPAPLVRFNHLISRGIAAFEMYDRDAAKAAFDEALAIAEQLGGKRNLSFVHGELAYLYSAFDKDVALALRHGQLAIDLAAEAKTPDLLATWLLNRGNVHRDAGNYDAALADYRRSTEVRGAGGPSFVVAKNTGQTYRLMGDLHRAREILAALVAPDQIGRGSLRHQWQAHMELASTYEALGQRGDAAQHYETMLEIIENQRSTAILDSFRTGVFAHTLAAYDPYDRYIRFLTSGGDEQEAAAAFHVSERARARSFLEMLASVRGSIVGHVPAALLAEEARIMRGISDTQRRLRAPDLPRADRDALLSELARHEQARDAFRVKLRVEHPTLAETRYPDVAGAPALQPGVRPDEAVISFFLGEQQSYRWTLTRDRVAFARLPGRARIEQAAGALRERLRTPGDAAGAHEAAGALAALLFAGLALPAGDLVVVPHGALHYVPFEVLPHGGALLVERHAVSYAPSANALAFLRRQPASDAPFRVLAIGAPQLDEGRVASAVRDGDVANVGLLGPLPSAAAELAAIRRLFPSATEVLEGAAARESALARSDLDRFRVLHVATHGVVSEAHPSRSALLFSAEEGEDGLLQTGDIYRLPLRTDLVVLSACQTALGREVTGEGIVGLTRAFFYSGSRAVMASLWNLNDRFAAEFVERFYGELRQGHSSQEALRRTKAAYVGDARYGHPFYWASMVLAGDGSQPLYRGSAMPVPAAWLWAAGGGVLLLASFWIYRRARRQPR